MREILNQAERIAKTEASVLIQGESGTGKEMLAYFIHSKSLRSQNHFVALNCAALPENLLESELFGYEKGAFTGAEKKKPGKFEVAHKGTFVLDEIGEMPLSLQAKLLRVLQEREMEPLGGKNSVPIDIRWIATTHRDLKNMVKQKSFREDLYYRLNVIPFYLPPLRKRKCDIGILSDFLVQKLCFKNNLEPKILSFGAKEKLKLWNWPGNIRELENSLERSILLCGRKEISKEDILISDSFPHEENEVSNFAPGVTLSQAEKTLILRTLDYTKQNKSHAAQILGISVRTLRNKIKNYKMEKLFQ